MKEEQFVDLVSDHDKAWLFEVLYSDPDETVTVEASHYHDRLSFLNETREHAAFLLYPEVFTVVSPAVNVPLVSGGLRSSHVDILLGQELELSCLFVVADASKQQI